MVYFDFGMNIIEQVIDELSLAEEYIRIAVFQLHNPAIFQILQDKVNMGIEVEIFTLPYDSINENVRVKVTDHFKQLITVGAVVHFCNWNIGTPERTTTAEGRWYSYHGKFIVTDKSAIILTANFIDQNQLDAIFIYRDDEQKINELNSHFYGLIDRFTNTDLDNEKNIRYMIMNSAYHDPNSLFQLPSVIHTTTHNDYWITDYPCELCPPDTVIQDKLYICPFDVRGRNLLHQIFKEAEEFISISTESLTDPDIVDDLLLRKFDGIEIKVITGARSMDFTDRLNKQFVTMLSSDILVRTPKEELHAKLVVTDKCVAVSSINFNKINLGFSRSSQLWRENTETIAIDTHADTIMDAKYKFDLLFLNSKKIEWILTGNLEKDVKKIFSKHYGLRSDRDTKELFARYIMQDEINAKRSIIRIGKITQSLLGFTKRRTVTVDDFLMALILHYLSDNKLKYNQLEVYLSRLGSESHLQQLLFNLQSYGFIVEDNDYYKLSVLSLF